MAKAKNTAPVVIDSQYQAANNPPLWLRITAFLSLKSANTQRTYKSIIEEWCHFLGAPPGSVKAAERIVAAKDINAIGYRAWLEKQIGQNDFQHAR